MELNTGMALGVEYFQRTGIGECEGKETFFAYVIETSGSTTRSTLHLTTGFTFHNI